MPGTQKNLKILKRCHVEQNCVFPCVRMACVSQRVYLSGMPAYNTCMAQAKCHVLVRCPWISVRTWQQDDWLLGPWAIPGPWALRTPDNNQDAGRRWQACLLNYSFVFRLLVSSIYFLTFFTLTHKCTWKEVKHWKELTSEVHAQPMRNIEWYKCGMGTWMDGTEVKQWKAQLTPEV